MPIVVRLDMMLARRRVRSKTLAAAVGITEANLSLFKSGKVKGLRFATLAAICRHLDCQPGDLLEYVPDQRATAPGDPAAAGAEALGAAGAMPNGHTHHR